MIINYRCEFEEQWDNFVLHESMNGNFLQTRNFLNYHKKGKFADCSLMFYQGETLVAVLPANEVENGTVMLSHQGSTFGGLIVGMRFCTTEHFKWIFEELMEHIEAKKYKRVELKMPHWLYAREDRNNELLNYYFQLYGFREQGEVGFFFDIKKLPEDFERDFETLKKRKLKKAIKYDLQFRELHSEKEIITFYDVLTDNMRKFNSTPIHSAAELLDFKEKRLPANVSFYGVYTEETMVAGSMVFDFCDKKVFHTQYLASKHDYLYLCPNEFLYWNLIREARNKGYRFLSLGTATLDHGNVYNESLGRFKEGFHADTYLNRTYIYQRDLPLCTN